MKKYPAVILSAFLLLLCFHPNVQAQKKYRISGKEAVDIALKHVIDLKNLELDRKTQLAKNREITGQALPQINGNAGFNHFFAIPVTLLPDFISPAVYGVLETEGVKDGNGDPITQGNAGPQQFFPARFGVPWTSTIGFQFQQLLFQPDVFVGLQARDAAMRFAEGNIKVFEDSVKSNVLRSYYGVLVIEKRIQFLEESNTRLQKLLKDQEQLYKNGFAERLDIDKTQVQLNNLESSLKQFGNLRSLGYASLKYVMGLTQRDTLELTDPLSMDRVKADLLDGGDFKYEDRNEIKLLNTVKELKQLDLKRYKLNYAPTIAAFWNYSQNAQRQEFNFFKSGQPWFTTSVVGVNMTVPLFDGLQRPNKIKQAKYSLEKTENDLINFKNVIDLQQVGAKTTLVNAIDALAIQERNLTLAEKVYNTTKLKFEQGVGSSFEIIQADTEYQNAQGNYFQALYEAVVARIGYLRSLGKL